MENLSKGIIINLTANTLLNTALKLQQERGLNNEELELVISKVLLDVTNAKSLEYASKIVNLTSKVQALDEALADLEVKQKEE